MKKFLIQIILLISVIGVGIVFFVPGKNPNLEIPFLPQQAKYNDLQINDTLLKVEVADTAAKRSKGLGGRQSLGENEGMLFVFDRADKYPFWMKGVSFALDFVWIKGDAVVDVLENVPPPVPGQSDAALPIYTAKEEIDKVLELNAGSVKKFNIKAGDKISVK